MNKRADFASIVFIVVLIFTIGAIFFFVSHVNDEIFNELNSTLYDDARNTTEIDKFIEKTIRTNTYVWDYAFLGVFLGSLVALGVTAYAVRISPIFYWIYGIMSLTVLVVGVVLSSAWQDLSADATFATTITRFPIMDAVLGSYYPLIVTAVILLSMIILFGKPPGMQEGFG